MKQVLVGLLWAYAFWYLGSTGSHFAGGPELLGPVLGLVVGVAAFVRLRDASRAYSPTTRRIDADLAADLA
jgi:hypothetical protein